jgi:uncharacterized protein (DUF58 family)
LLFVNEPARATLVVKNGKSWLPSFSLKLFDVSDGLDHDRGLTVGQLLPGASRLVSYPLAATRRGQLRLDGVRVVTSFPFGLFLKKAYYPVDGTVTVCPAIKPLAEDLLDDVLVAGQDHAAHRRGHGNELYNLRLYQAGDDSRNIHWVTTARTAKLMVRETEAEDQRRASIHLSLFAPDSHDREFEEAVTFTASLLHHLAIRGYYLKLTAGSFRSPFGEGEEHLLELLRILALCERRSSNVGLLSRDALFMETQDEEGGALIVVRPWSGTAIPDANNKAVLIDTETFTGFPYAV